MSMSVNRAIIAGRITRDPELKTTSSQNAMVNLLVRSTMPRDDGQGTVEEHHRVVAFGKTAENIGKFLSEGSALLIEGRVQTRSFEGQDGGKRTVTEIVADSAQFYPKELPAEVPIGINKVFLVGNAGSDMELKFGKNDTAVGKVGVAVSGRRTNGAEPATEWLNVVAFGDTALEATTHVTKGVPVVVEGRLNNRSFEGEDGQKRYVTEIVAKAIEPAIGFAPSLEDDQAPGR